jgi:ribosomal protein S18 acetylase RimI-like enzyme
MPLEKKKSQVKIKIERLNDFKNTDLTDLCDATETTILDSSLSFNIGLKRSEPLVRERLEAYWRGVSLVTERVLIVGRLDGVIASSIQLIKPNPNNQTSKFSCSINHHFVAPWARGHGLAKQLLTAAEDEAKASGLSLIKLNVRADLDGAIKLYESCGYRRWGTLDKFEIIEGKMIAGHFYCKDL